LHPQSNRARFQFLHKKKNQYFHTATIAIRKELWSLWELKESHTYHTATATSQGRMPRPLVVLEPRKQTTQSQRNKPENKRTEAMKRRHEMRTCIAAAETPRLLNPRIYLPGGAAQLTAALHTAPNELSSTW